MKNTFYKPALPHFRIPKKFLPDQDILTLVNNGDIEAFDIFSSRYKNGLVNYVFRFFNDYKLSLNIVQETFLRTLRHRQTLIGVNDLNVKIFSIASNLMNDKQRQRKKQRILFFRKRIKNIEKSACTNQLKSNDLSLDTMIQIALDSLPDTYREAIILRDIEGMNYSDISAITHVPIKKVKYRVNEARLKLNDYLIGCQIP
jgi:RNA polymerase sigma-70 factor, ECF subfamily